MAKKFLKSLITGIAVFAVSVLCGYISYLITFRYQTQKMEETLLKDTAAAANSDTAPLAEEDIIQVDYYTARLENNDIAIYVCSGNKESFLYSLGVYAYDFPAADLERLKEGIILNSRRELTAFEEDFTS